MQTLEKTGQKSIEWAAGLFEGEGCIYQKKGRKNPSWSIRIKMTDLDVLQSFHSTVDAGHLTGPYHPPSLKPHHKSFWHWETAKKDDVIKVLTALLPYLGYRRAKLVLTCFQDYGLNYAIN